jgi:hypothetical protein
VIDTLISAVRAGELDDLFSQAARLPGSQQIRQNSTRCAVYRASLRDLRSPAGVSTGSGAILGRNSLRSRRTSV